ncbi:nucleoside triphosphate pyrophosphohydrolase family protein [Marinithermus hydrothermalis]|uniref:MazG nucleotide pyrophosphohydrolase n=1 Tax=Marinithermus hydrothermalis (strain DSM 14884 / JCM 11576 / T1) TaxID=869210 RepID=F2NLK9_MARHT|nr:nucleoside triphosphate pyrophosphohydrolase family protein [Marinithermus hydrothermalis]AEB12108.1 MazG nucleotide pyrophosphohydrolase [Marinithermus hydrothermalis DSM 14884]
MTLNEYQTQARRTALYPEEAWLVYPTLGLAGEAGELANKIKKLLRDHADARAALEDAALREEVLQELGDVLWYVAAVASDLGVPLEEVARMNLAKLSSRMARGRIGGSGDRR